MRSERGDGGHILDVHLAGEQEADGVDAGFLHRDAQEVVHAHEAFEIDRVLREGRAAGGKAAAHNAPRVFKRAEVIVRALAEESVELEEVGPVHRHLNGEHAIGEAQHARGIHRARDEFGKHRKAFLRARCARVTGREEGKCRLRSAVQRCGDMYKRFMLHELRYIAIGEGGVFAQADIARAGKRIG